MSRQMFKAYPELQQLDKYSAQVAKRIYRYRPQWMPLIEIDETIFRIKLEAPDHSAGSDDMVISTQDHRLTVFFDHYHAHFDQFESQDSNEEFARAMRFVDTILNEELVAVIKTGGDGWRGSRVVTPDKLEEVGPHNATYTRSWRGTYNRVYG